MSDWKYWLGTIVLAAVFGTMNVSAAETVYLIDVRTPQEFAQGHLAGAINIEHQEIADKIGSVTTDKNAHIELYCRSGNRSGVALRRLREAGYQNAINLGGFEELRKTRPTAQ
ncbi:MAG: rhodanese-like domain-containing protein [Burkholderiales bacterium]|jgi:phage shock protein E|nr:rhodanese-like domain-containing protein [Burkholderiales bacterium]